MQSKHLHIPDPAVLMQIKDYPPCCEDALTWRDERIAQLEAENNLFNDHLVKAADRIEELEAKIKAAYEHGYRDGVHMFADYLPDESHLRDEINEAWELSGLLKGKGRE